MYPDRASEMAHLRPPLASRDPVMPRSAEGSTPEAGRGNTVGQVLCTRKRMCLRLLEADQQFPPATCRKRNTGPITRPRVTGTEVTPFLSLRSARDIACNASALATLQGNLRARRRRKVVWRAFDLAGTRRTAQRRAIPVVRDQVERLYWIVGSRARFAHWPSDMISHYPGPDRGAGTPLTNSNP